MSLPWVARERLDAMQRLLDIAHAENRQERNIADARYDDLLEKYHALASPVSPVTAIPAERESVTPSIVTQAIRDEAAGDPRLAGYLRKRAQELRRDGKLTEDEIAQQLRTWSTTQDDAA